MSPTSLGPVLDRPAPANLYQRDFVARLAQSFAHVTGGDLAAEFGLDPAQLGKSAWEGNFALLSHRGDDQATLNYANRFVLDLWEMDWAVFTATPSAATAPAEDSAERDRVMRGVAEQGFVRGYRGRRVSRSGRLFWIENVTIWRLLTADGGSFGVAAAFAGVRADQFAITMRP